MYQFTLTKILGSVVTLMEENIPYIKLIEIVNDIGNSMFGFDNFSFILEEVNIKLIFLFVYFLI